MKNRTNFLLTNKIFQKFEYANCKKTRYCCRSVTKAGRRFHSFCKGRTFSLPRFCPTLRQFIPYLVTNQPTLLCWLDSHIRGFEVAFFNKVLQLALANAHRARWKALHSIYKQFTLWAKPFGDKQCKIIAFIFIFVSRTFEACKEKLDIGNWFRKLFTRDNRDAASIQWIANRTNKRQA